VGGGEGEGGGGAEEACAENEVIRWGGHWVFCFVLGLLLGWVWLSCAGK
jgi:hypothetical protein